MPGWVWMLVLAWHAIACAVSASLYAIDKRRAVKGGWRIPEKRLHLVDLLGGWPGGWLARRRLRHKTSKSGFVVVFWITAVLHAAAIGAGGWLILT